MMVHFTLLPVLDIMINFYKKPPSQARFQDYLNLLSPNRSKTLLHHIQQEAFVKKKMEITEIDYEEGDLVQALFNTHKSNTGEPFILAFLYGDKVVEQLGHRAIGAFADMGFLMARQLVKI
jgi:hypothetical protein